MTDSLLTCEAWVQSLAGVEEDLFHDFSKKYFNMKFSLSVVSDVAVILNNAFFPYMLFEFQKMSMNT